MLADNVVCILRYLVKGVAPERDDRSDLQNELLELLPHANAVTVLPVVQGLSVEIELTELAPFTRSSIEPYIAEHILPEAVAIRCRTHGEVQLQLLKAYYS